MRFLSVVLGLRVSELTALACADAHLDTGPHLRCTEKAPNQRCTPLTRPTARLLGKWIADRYADPGDPLYPSQTAGTSAATRSPICWTGADRRAAGPGRAGPVGPEHQSR